MMIRRGATPNSNAALAALWVAGATLGACSRNSPPPAAPAAASADVAPPALPLTIGPQTPVAPAPALAELPLRAPVRVTRLRDPREGYGYVDQAYGMSRAIGRAPPDYGFDYGATRPWVWRTSRNALRIVEPVEDGERYYYYQPGAADPYLVQDPSYSYAYSNGLLAAVYDSSGRELAYDQVDARADAAARYLGRAHGLYEAAQRSERHSVVAANWAARRDAVDAERARWAEQEASRSDWRAYHAQHDAEQQAYWRSEQDRREQTASSFDDWSRGGYRDSPPPPVAAPLAIAGAALAAGALLRPHDARRGDHATSVGGDNRLGGGGDPVFGRAARAPEALGDTAATPRGLRAPLDQVNAYTTQQQLHAAAQPRQTERLQQAARAQTEANDQAQAMQARARSAAQVHAAQGQPVQAQAMHEQAVQEQAMLARRAQQTMLARQAAAQRQQQAMVAERAQVQRGQAAQAQDIQARARAEAVQAQAMQAQRARQAAQAQAEGQRQQSAAAELAQAQRGQAAQAQALQAQRAQQAAQAQQAHAQEAAQAQAQAQAQAHAQARTAAAAVPPARPAAAPPKGADHGGDRRGEGGAHP